MTIIINHLTDDTQATPYYSGNNGVVYIQFWTRSYEVAA
jgi:hypothetical protein